MPSEAIDIAHARPSPVLAIATLARREVVRFLRQRSRVASALGSPVVFWALIGLGFGRSFSPPGSTRETGYLEYFFPGTLTLILLFSSVFSNISLIEDRREGFLQAVLVSPASRLSIVVGKILGGALLAWGQAMAFCLYLLTPWSTVHLGPGEWVLLAGVVFLVSFAMSGLGFLIAWPMDSTQGFHAIMNLLLIPMWMLSGALFPASGAPGWLQWVITLNPLSYGVLAIQHVFYEDVRAVVGGSPAGLGTALAVTAAFAVLVIVVAGAWARAPRTR